MMPQVKAICISSEKGQRKCPVDHAWLQESLGIEGDAHAGQWHRQVSLLAAEDIESLRQKLPDIQPGDFAENIIIEGLGLQNIGLGSRLRIGSNAELMVTQLGKTCHSPCRIFHLTGDCIMPRRGVFARVVGSGHIAAGEQIEIVRLVPRHVAQCVVLTISDRCSRGETEDTAGPAVAATMRERLRANIYRLAVLPDEQEQISQMLKHYSDGHSIDVLLTVGGTGFSPRDVTPEATRAVVKRLTPGLDEAMRSASLRRTPHAMLSRAVSGIRGSTLIINLPGSRRAALQNLEVILPALQHAIDNLRGDTTDCGRGQQEAPFASSPVQTSGSDNDGNQ
jgi:molybdopterin adenylyltransferase